MQTRAVKIIVSILIFYTHPSFKITEALLRIFLILLLSKWRIQWFVHMKFDWTENRWNEHTNRSRFSMKVNKIICGCGGNEFFAADVVGWKSSAWSISASFFATACPLAFARALANFFFVICTPLGMWYLLATVAWRALCWAYSRDWRGGAKRWHLMREHTARRGV